MPTTPPALPAPQPLRRTALSIEEKLPLLISGLLLLVVGAYSTATYRAVRRSALDAATQRLVVAGERLAQISEASTRQTASRMRAAATSPAVRAYVRLPLAGRQGEVYEALRPLLPASGGVAWVELWTAAGERVLTAGTAAPPEPKLRLAGELSVRPARPDSMVSGPVRVEGDSVFTSSVIPVADGGTVVGYLVRWGRLGVAAQTRKQIEDLIGADATLYFGHVPSGVITDIAGVPARLPIDLRDRRVTLAYDQPGKGRMLAAKVPVRGGQPWVLLPAASRRDVLAHQDALFRRLAVVALVLIVAGGGAGWLVSRRITQPLRQVTAAADAVAAGDYSRRLTTAHADELGRLAATFNLMSERVEDSQRRLRAATEAAESGNRAKSQFLATMSHEIRTPLNAILGYADLLRMEIAGPLTPQQSIYLERVQSSCRHLTTLISDVLDLSKIEADRLEVRRAPAGAGRVVRAALDLVQLQAQARRLTMETGACDETGTVRYHGDEARVKQILVNLLSNAIKFTEPGGRVTVSCGVTGHPEPGTALDGAGPWTFICVEDSGIGISPDRLAAVWEPFVQGDMGHTRAHGGTGLGLTISRRLARMMGGDVTCQSEPGVGSAFFLWLPAASAPDPSAAPATLPDFTAVTARG